MFSRYVSILAVLDSHITIKFFLPRGAQECIDAPNWGVLGLNPDLAIFGCLILIQLISQILLLLKLIGNEF